MAGAGLLASACDSGGEGSGQPTGAPATTSTPESTPDPTTLSRASAPGASRVTPVPRVFDARAMQASVERILTQSYRIEDVESVTCPPRQPVRAGWTFDCTAVIAGEPARVPITVRGEDDQYEVGYPE